jgi:DNA-binding transcriptional LysR family regulator
MGVNWDDLRFLLELRRAGSLGAAARALKVEASTVSRRLASLETALGVQLAARTPEGLVLNDAGELAGELAETMDAGVTELLRRVGGDDQRAEGLVRVSATDSMASLLMRGLQPLRQAHPAIQVQLVVSNAALDLVRREADVAVRLFREQNPALVTRKIGDIGWSVYAARTYVEQRGLAVGVVPSPGWLEGQAIVSYRGPAGRSAGGAWLTANTRPSDVVLTCDGVQAVASALKAGLGMSAIPCFVAHGDPALVRITPAVVATVEAFVVIPPDHRRTVRIRVVTDAIAELFERERATLTGFDASS